MANKSFIRLLLIPAAFILASWGTLGHHVIGEIAQRHLTPKAQEAVTKLLGHETLADVSSWADEIIPQRKETAPLHFINLPLGLSFSAFKRQVESETNGNVYSAIINAVNELKNTNIPPSMKVETLKFLVHFVGDIHQPMHVSNAEDKGGNTIEVTYNGNESNLHSVWDSELIEQDGNDYNKLADKYDHAAADEIKKWQSDPVIDWAWESYQISSQLYSEVNKPSGASMGNEYYNAHIGIVQQRIEKAGIRLAGLLNQVFTNEVVLALGKSYPPPIVSTGGRSSMFPPVDLKDVSKHIGEQINVRATVAGYKEEQDMLLINLGAPYPNSPLTLVFKGYNKKIGEAFKTKGTKVLVLGTITEYNGKPEIEITRDNQLFNQPGNN